MQSHTVHVHKILSILNILLIYVNKENWLSMRAHIMTKPHYETGEQYKKSTTCNWQNK